MKRKIFWTMLFIFIGGLAYYVFSGTEDTKKLTTTVDVARKTISGDESAAADENGHGTFTGLFSNAADGVSAALKDNMSMLAAAASPGVTFVKITPGMRKEEIADILQKKLSWDGKNKDKFLETGKLASAVNMEGYYYPDSYTIPKKADGEAVKQLMMSRFNEKVVSRYASSTAKIINIDTAMKIASIIEREAGGKSDMRLISGIIWNRMFKDMTLDVDATLQYVKGNKEDGWWPRVNPEDKFLDSPYNTYQNKGLTPTPISNPHLAAIDAALNPEKTKCMFYLHDKYRRIHCSASYKGHVKNIEKYYGKR